jgi:hypothetical protein
MGAQLTALCPFAVLTARLQPLGMSPFRKPRRIGVFPSWVRRRERRREGGKWGKWGKERRSGEGEAAPVTPPVRQDRRPFASTGSRTSRRVEGEPGQSKKWSVAVNTYTVPPSSPSRRRLHRGPNVS